MCAVGMHPPHLENSYPDLGLEIISNLTLAFFFFLMGVELPTARGRIWGKRAAENNNGSD